MGIGLEDVSMTCSTGVTRLKDKNRSQEYMDVRSSKSAPYKWKWVRVVC